MDVIEDRVRAMCEIGLIANGLPAGRKLADAVDRYWPVYAAELQLGVVGIFLRDNL